MHPSGESQAIIALFTKYWLRMTTWLMNLLFVSFL
jgi:hypothetical protein